MFQIIVNGKTKHFERERITYVDILSMTDLDFSPDLIVMYRKPILGSPGQYVEGSLTQYDSIIIRDQMHFEVKNVS